MHTHTHLHTHTHTHSGRAVIFRLQVTLSGTPWWQQPLHWTQVLFGLCLLPLPSPAAHPTASLSSPPPPAEKAGCGHRDRGAREGVKSLTCPQNPAQPSLGANSCDAGLDLPFKDSNQADEAHHSSAKKMQKTGKLCLSITYGSHIIQSKHW